MRQDDERPNAGSSPTRWELIHRRLEAVQRMIEDGHAPTAEQEKVILKARARAMAQEPLHAQRNLPGAEPELEIVTFRLAHETYGFESRHIREIYPLKELTPLPCTPPFVLGLINLRGRLLSVLDLKKFFGLSSQALDNHNQVIILHSETMEFGVLADALLGVYPIAPQSLQPSLPTLTSFRNEFLLGVTPDLVIILDAEKLLSNREILVHEEVET
ncbi:MAG: purine-binding chemotaxis protein CheW [Caldilineaceae bacterium]|nr:purine-binding chemotaxis protein CheW [Caldilineaceae bacterium]